MYKIVQCRSTEGKPEVCNQTKECTRIKEARGEQKSLFNSHLEMMYGHEMYEYWDEWEVDEGGFKLTAYKDNVMIYSYRVVLEDVEEK